MRDKCVITKMKTTQTLKETLISSLPLAAIIIVMCVFVAPMEGALNYVKLLVGYMAVVIGQSLFLVGLDKSILPIGKMVGSSLSKLKKAGFIVGFGVLFGLLSTVAEPALAVLARQTNMLIGIVDTSTFIWISSFGIGAFIGFALYRILKNFNIKTVFAILYAAVFLMVFFVPEEFISLSFDSSGATTGDISVPFILVLGVGASATMSRKKTNDDTFGIIGIASIGPILSVFIYGIILKIKNGGVIPPANEYAAGTADTLGSLLLSNLWDVALAILPIVIVFLFFQFCFIKLPSKELAKIMFGTIPVYLGLLIFLTGIDYGFAYAAKYIGEIFFDASRPEWYRWLLLVVGFILGVAITLSEPAVTVLGDQVEDITNGHIKKQTIRMTLAIGIGFASLMGILKILTQINILYFLAPLYAIALILMRFTPKLFVSLAFDSGGVTGGALTSAFLTPLTLGIAQAVAADAGPNAQSILTNGFGIIAFISVAPLIAVQVLGIIYEIRISKVQEISWEDERTGLESLMLSDEPQPEENSDGGEIESENSNQNTLMEMDRHD